MDYIIGNVNAASLLHHCFTHPQAPLNSSDHLPITAVLNLDIPSTYNTDTDVIQQVNWHKARESSALGDYQNRVNPLLGKPYENPDSLDKEFNEVTSKILQAALECLPCRKPPKKRAKWYQDNTLGRLAIEKKAAWDRWKAGGRPLSGPLFDEKSRSRAEFGRLSFCQRKRLRIFDKRFKETNPYRFRLPKKRVNMILHF